VLPNFFLAGAPKAGTTSLYHYLAQHPQIYMSPIKEPCYFGTEFRAENCCDALRPDVDRSQRELQRYLAGPMGTRPFGGMVANWDDYLKLFAGARGEPAIGEASPGYLWSKTAARNIQAKVPAAKLLFVLRDPADRAFSQYLHGLASGRLRRTFREHIDANLKNRSEKFSFDFPLLEFGLYSDPLRRYFDLFPPENIFIRLYDDYRAGPAQLFSSMFSFLQVEPGFVPDTSKRHLEAHVPRRPVIARWLRKAGILQTVKRLTPRELLPAARRMVFAPREQLKMSAEDRKFLVDYYTDDIHDLERLIDRDLSAWLKR
jgi:hypothetical protein